MQDDSTIIEGSVKFRDGKKWKSRWCVMRKLSPVADCVHLQLYRDWRARAAGAGCKAALSLQHYVGCEAAFTLDNHSNTLALLCTDLVAILAFETRERLMQWQVKVNAHLGEARHHLVLVGSGAECAGGKARGARGERGERGERGARGGRLAPGPARLHLLERRFALTQGVPPRLLGVWEIAHLRRYGVVEGRFCFEGGSHCGKGEGLHVLITDRAKEISVDFDLASRGLLSPRRRPLHSRKNDGAQSPKSHKAFRPDTRLSDLNAGEPRPSERSGAASPCWPSAEAPYRDMGLGDTASVHGADAAAGWPGAGRVALERCASCMSKLGALSRSSTAALTPGAQHFSPAWTMDALHEACAETSAPEPSRAEPSLADLDPVVDKTEDVCAPGRPPKPNRLELNLNRKAPMPLPTQTCTCSCTSEEKKSKIGPYENYDVPKLSSMEIDGEYYDTPKRIKECLNDELFKMTRSSTSNAVILKKPCGCLLKLGRRRREPTIISADDNVPPAPCPCRRVTDWANSWIRLPYCRKSTVSTDDLAQNKENSKPDAHTALYATIDLSRKTRRKTHPTKPDEFMRLDSRTVEVDEGPLANYENLNFALSLEYYENAKDLLRRAGVTQSELDAISANLVPREAPAGSGSERERTFGDDYLMMEPKSLDDGKPGRSRTPLASAGYAPMSPIGGFAFPAARAPPRGSALGDKSASNPSLGGEGRDEREGRGAERRKRSSSADSSRFLDDVKEFDGRGSSSSIETLRNLAPVDVGAGAMPGGAGAGNRDSSSSNDSGVSSCELRRELPPTSAAARRTFRSARRAAAAAPRAPPARRSRSGDPAPRRARAPPAPRSAEAEGLLLSVRELRGIVDTHSTSSGTSDMSDYIETLSICSSHSSTDTPVTMRMVRPVTTSTLRPRSGKEYGRLAPRRAPPGPPPSPGAPAP